MYDKLKAFLKSHCLGSSFKAVKAQCLKPLTSSISSLKWAAATATAAATAAAATATATAAATAAAATAICYSSPKIINGKVLIKA